MDVKEITAPVTKEIVLDTADRAAKSYGTLKKKYPKTAEALVYSSLPIKDAHRDDKDILLARQAIMDIDSNTRQNMVNLIESEFGKERNYKWDRVCNTLQKLHKLTSSESPDELFANVHREISDWRKVLLSGELRPQIREPLRKAVKHPREYPHEIAWRLEKYEDLIGASEELVPHLTRKPGKILEEIQ